MSKAQIAKKNKGSLILQVAGDFYIGGDSEKSQKSTAASVIDAIREISCPWYTVVK